MRRWIRRLLDIDHSPSRALLGKCRCRRCRNGESTWSPAEAFTTGDRTATALARSGDWGLPPKVCGQQTGHAPDPDPGTTTWASVLEGLPGPRTCACGSVVWEPRARHTDHPAPSGGSNTHNTNTHRIEN